MANTHPQLQSQPDQGGSGWLVNTSHQQVVHFKPEASLGTTAWVSIRMYQYDPARPLEPISHRRILQQSAIDTWSMMLKQGWRPCRALAR